MVASSSLEFHWSMMIWRAVCFSYRIRPMKANEIERIYIDTYWRLFIFRPKLSILSKSQYVKHSFCCAFHLNKRQRERETPSYRYFTHFRCIWCWALEFIEIMLKGRCSALIGPVWPCSSLFTQLYSIIEIIEFIIELLWLQYYYKLLLYQS